MQRRPVSKSILFFCDSIAQRPTGSQGPQGPTGAAGPTGPIGQYTEAANWATSDESSLGKYMHSVTGTHGKGAYPSVVFIETSTHRQYSGTVVYPNANGSGIKIYSNKNAEGIIVVRP